MPIAACPSSQPFFPLRLIQHHSSFLKFFSFISKFLRFQFITSHWQLLSSIPQTHLLTPPHGTVEGSHSLSSRPGASSIVYFMPCWLTFYFQAWFWLHNRISSTQSEFVLSSCICIVWWHCQAWSPKLTPLSDPVTVSSHADVQCLAYR